MRKYSGLVAVSALAVIVGGISAPVMAQTQTQTQTLNFTANSGTFTYIAPTSPSTVGTFNPLSFTGSFAKFDPSQGTLISATFTLSYNFTATDSISKYDTSPATASGSLSQTVTTTITVSGVNAVTGSTGGGPSTFAVAQGVGQKATVPFTSSSSGSSLGYTDATFLATLQGPGTQAFTGTANSSATLTTTTGTPYLSDSVTQISALTGTVVYEFAPTPAPPGVVSGLIGIAMGGAQFGVMKFRRRRAKKTEAAEVAA